MVVGEAEVVGLVEEEAAEEGEGEEADEDVSICITVDLKSLFLNPVSKFEVNILRHICKIKPTNEQFQPL